MVKESKNLVVGLDIGTSKIVAIVAEVTPEGELNVIGMGTQPSRGLKKGVVVNIEATMATIFDVPISRPTTKLLLSFTMRCPLVFLKQPA